MADIKKTLTLVIIKNGGEPKYIVAHNDEAAKRYAQDHLIESGLLKECADVAYYDRRDRQRINEMSNIAYNNPFGDAIENLSNGEVSIEKHTIEYECEEIEPIRFIKPGFSKG